MHIPHELYPFRANYARIGGHRMHYVDEGKGQPVVMVHGNPTWSFYYRNLVLSLKGEYRCIAPDHIGCGFSDKPGDDAYAYTFEQRVDDLEALIDSLELEEKITLVLHDWGGMIGMAWATRHPERVKSIVLLNTAAFLLPKTKRSIPFPLKLTRTPLGAFLVRGFNAFSRGALATCCTSKRLSQAEKDAYVAPYDSWQNRIATLRFVQDIPLDPGEAGYDAIEEVSSKLHLFRQTPTMICWGEKDFVFDHHFLGVWKDYLPEATIHRFPDGGHYILEDAAAEIHAHVREFLTAEPAQA